jgi:hypothetical protein
VFFLVLNLVCEFFGHHFNQIVNLFHEAVFQVFERVKIGFGLESGVNAVKTVLDVAA